MVEVPHCPSPRRVLVGLQVELGRGRLHPEIPVGTAQRAQPRGGPARGARGLSFQGSTRNGQVGALRAPGRPPEPLRQPSRPQAEHLKARAEVTGTEPGQLTEAVGAKPGSRCNRGTRRESSFPQPGCPAQACSAN